MTANDIVNKALNEVGVKEYPPNSNNVKYNTIYYGRNVAGNYPWCCAFIWWLLSTSGVKCPKTASCITMANWFKNEGRWYTSNPQIGDLVFFHFKTNSRWTNHVGIVVGVRGNEIETVEGNTSINSNDNGGSVMKRKRSSNIVGYGRPNYESAESTVYPVLRRGSKGAEVRAWQSYLTACGIDVGSIDGDYGKKTEAGVKIYQKQRKLPVTGIIDDDDWNSVGK